MWQDTLDKPGLATHSNLDGNDATKWAAVVAENASSAGYEFKALNTLKTRHGLSNG